MVIRRLEEQDEVDGFDCGDGALTNYLKRHAWINQQKVSIGVCYDAVDESAPRAVLGYFTLAMASLSREEFPRKYIRGLPPYADSIGAVGRRSTVCRSGVGHALISEALRIGLRAAEEVGCRCIVTDAYRDRISWYAKYGFVPIEGGERQLAENFS